MTVNAKLMNAIFIQQKCPPSLLNGIDNCHTIFYVLLKIVLFFCRTIFHIFIYIAIIISISFEFLTKNLNMYDQITYFNYTWVSKVITFFDFNTQIIILNTIDNTGAVQKEYHCLATVKY